MTDNFNNNGYEGYNNNPSDNVTDTSYKADSDNVVNSETAESNTESQTEAAETQTESSYEWNSDNTQDSGSEYHYSYVNGNNQTASHNPNNYDNAYSAASNSQTSNQGYGNTGSYTGNSAYSNTNSSYGNNNGYGSSQYGQQASNPYGSYNGSDPYNYQPQYGYNHANTKAKKVKTKKPKRPKKSASRGFVVGALIICVLATTAFGFCGGIAYSNLSKSSGGLNVNKVDSNSSGSTSGVTEGTATAVVQKAADSVVEITTESVVSGSFNQQYVSSGAGSGVIISEDGYIVTNNHVISDANTIEVTLRDGQTSYEAELIGTDSANDIALLKIDETGLTAATFGDSSTLAVGDYVVAIGNPLGQLGGTVTDGIISALAREVTIDDQSMTLLQTNAEINPGNSGGGLFDANGNLIGIVNAKSSATEVEGIGFAIPINNVFDIIDDLKNYGYVTGEIDLGMEFVDINSTETAFYYGVNNTGCYVLSVTSGSNADNAGFRAGDLIQKVDNTEVSSTSDIDAVISDKEVGDKVTFTVYRNGKTLDLELTLAEYVPTSNNLKQSSQTSQSDDSDNSFWSEMFGWY